MAFIYETFGPFDIERDGNKLRKTALTAFWSEREVDAPGLSGAIGIYIFTVRATKKSIPKPWYVGKTDQQGFKKRFSQQLNRFGDVLDVAKNGTPQIFLLGRVTPSRKAFMKPRSEPLRTNDDLESMLIGSCLLQNKNLVNASKIKHLKELQVPGYLNNKQGKMSKAATEFNRMVKAK